MKNCLLAVTSILILTSMVSGCKQNRQTSTAVSERPVVNKQLVGGGCDGCDLMFQGMPELITAVDTNPAWFVEGEKLCITGHIVDANMQPVPNIIMYYWQTDNTGRYSPKQDAPRNNPVHGHIRGWVKTDSTGGYAIYTIKPAPYPGRDVEAHIHPAIKEPNKDEYYIDDFVFEGDTLLTSAKRKALPNRGGSGVVTLQKKDDIWYGARVIILGLNIPDYPNW